MAWSTRWTVARDQWARVVFKDLEVAAEFDHRLPVEAVREALVFVESKLELLATEAETERLMVKRGETSNGSQPVP